jgi:hypothetical protein
MRERFNDMPGDIAGEAAGDLPGGFGVGNPDNDPNALVDEVTGMEVVGPDSTEFVETNQPVGDMAGTGVADGQHTGASVDPADLLEGNEGHPGAAIGFTEEEPEKR